LLLSLSFPLLLLLLPHHIQTSSPDVTLPFPLSSLSDSLLHRQKLTRRDAVVLEVVLDRMVLMEVSVELSMLIVSGGWVVLTTSAR